MSLLRKVVSGEVTIDHIGECGCCLCHGRLPLDMRQVIATIPGTIGTLPLIIHDRDGI